MYLENGKFIEAVFLNSATSKRKNVVALWQDNETSEIQEIVIEMNLEDSTYRKLLEQYSIDEISAMTDQKLAKQKESFIAMVKQIAVNEGMIYNPNYDNKDSATIDHVFAPPEGDAGTDLLFNIKLKIFDLAEVVESNNTELKKKLREAKTPLESFYIAGKFLFE